MVILKKYSRILIGGSIGLLVGYLYWREVGCISGTCPITSSPLNSTLYGGMMGSLAGNIFQKNNN